MNAIPTFQENFIQALVNERKKLKLSQKTLATKLNWTMYKIRKFENTKPNDVVTTDLFRYARAVNFSVKIKLVE